MKSREQIMIMYNENKKLQKMNESDLKECYTESESEYYRQQIHLYSNICSIISEILDG